MFSGDFGFRVFKLDTSNVRAWEPDQDNMEGTLLQNVDHIKPDRSEEDILHEVLLKLGLDLCVPIETRNIVGKSVRSIGAGTLIACLDEKITREEVEPLALGIAEWRAELDCLRPNDKSYCYPPFIIRPVSIVRVLYQLIQDSVAVLGADHLVQVPKTFVDLEAFPLCVNGIFPARTGPAPSSPQPEAAPAGGYPARRDRASGSRQRRSFA